MATANYPAGSDSESLRVFISVAGPDRGWARWIGHQLRRAGYTVEYDEWWPPGTSFPAKMDAALAAADKIVAVVSPAYLDPNSLGREDREAAAGLAHTRQGAFVPVLVAPTTLPPPLGRLPHISLVGLREQEARDRLLSGLRGLEPPGLDDDVPWPPESVTRSETAAVDAADPFPGRLDRLARQVAAALPGYDVGERLGAGSFGVVLAARHRALDRRVAVKVLSADREEAYARFGSEARVLAGLDEHPHVVRVYDYIEHDDFHLIVMQLLTGGTLTDRRSGMSQPDACAVGLAVAEALSYVHERGVLHRDIKPDNMLFDADGLLKVTDFGIAKIFDESAVSASAVIGTPKYMAPEQISGEKLGPATDLYALAAVVYELLSGAPMFGANLPLRALYHRHLNVVPPPPQGVPAPVSAVVMRALAKDPAKRHRSAHAFALDLAAAAARSYGADWVAQSSVKLYLSDDVRAAATPPPPPVVSPPKAGSGGRSSRRAFLGVGLAASAAAVAATVFLWPDRAEARPVLGECAHVSVLTGQMDSPYYRYGVAVADRIQADYPGTTANAQPTTGSAYNLESIRDPAGAKCVVSVVQFTTAVDARNGVLQFEGSAIEQVRAVGPVWFDLLQLVVRQDSGIAAASDLCQRRVATGLPQSGTYQIGGVFFRQVSRQASEPCQPELVPETLPDGLADLRDGDVAAVLWAGGSPTEEIRDAVAGGLAVRLLPIDTYIGDMQREWDEFYGGRLGSSFVPGPVYAAQTTSAGDYPGVPPTATVAVPNGLVVNKDADPQLVEFTARTLFEHRGDLESVLWETGGEQRHFLTAQQTVGTSPVYCLVPLHPAALSYYQSIGVTPPCPPAVPPAS